MTSIEETVCEILEYVPQHPAGDRADVLADELNEHVEHEALYAALAALTAEDRARIGFDDIGTRDDFRGAMLAHNPRLLPY